jgi:nucleotide-binding universal stress UspA family protein
MTLLAAIDTWPTRGEFIRMAVVVLDLAAILSVVAGRGSLLRKLAIVADPPADGVRARRPTDETRHADGPLAAPLPAAASGPAFASVPVYPPRPETPMRRILTPLDGSPRGDQILTFIDRLLPESRVRELVLLRVLADLPTSEVARGHLDRIAHGLREGGLTATTLLTLADDPAAEIVKLAGLIRPWLTALSTHGAGEGRSVRGSIAAGVIPACPGPLLLVGRQALPIDPGPGCARILVALDGSRCAEAVLPIVGELARPSGAEVVLLTVGEPGRSAPTHLEVARAKLEEAGVDRVRVLQAGGDVADALLVATRREAADLLAMGARGATGGPGLGSVARSVAQRCDCPLLLAR